MLCASPLVSDENASVSMKSLLLRSKDNSLELPVGIQRRIPDHLEPPVQWCQPSVVVHVCAVGLTRIVILETSQAVRLEIVRWGDQKVAASNLKLCPVYTR